MIGRRRPIHIGLSARIYHPEQGRSGIWTKTLQVLEQSVTQWVMDCDVLVLMVPSVVQDGLLMRSNIRVRDYADYLDGLILQGGPTLPRAPTAKSRYGRSGEGTLSAMPTRWSCCTNSWRRANPYSVSAAACN